MASQAERDSPLQTQKSREAREGEETLEASRSEFVRITAFVTLSVCGRPDSDSSWNLATAKENSLFTRSPIDLRMPWDSVSRECLRQLRS